MHQNRYLGIDIGGTKCAVSIGGVDGRIERREEIPTAGSPDKTLAQLESMAGSFIQAAGKIDAIGIVCGGPMDSVKGLIQSPPNLPGWDDVPVVEYFRNLCQVPCFLQNDANAGALAEWMHGAGQRCRNMMFCTMGTGFGCGLILNHSLYAGSTGDAGELGHVRLTPEGPLGFGKAGSVEGWCSGGGMAQLARRSEANRQVSNPSAKDIAQAAVCGETWALEIFAEVGRKLGATLAIAIDLLNLEMIVIGSIFSRQEALIRPSMETVLREECLPTNLRACRILPARLGDTIGDVAALTVAHLGLNNQLKLPC